ncbi:hypothetical protein SLA2020_075750 [Shorea laevis]
MDFINFFLNLAVPPACLVMLAFVWPTLCFIRASSSGIGEQIAHEYAKRGASLLLVARREDRLRRISEKARHIGAKQVLITAADVVKEDDCRRFVNEAITYCGRLDHLVNTESLGHTFYFKEVLDTSVFPRLMDVNFWGNVYPTFAALPYLRQTNGRVIVNASVENWLPLPRMSLYSAAKAALVNFYETLKFELNDEIGLTIATHGWTGSEMSRGKFMLEEGAEMQWKEEREVQATPAGPVEEFAKLIVAGACRGDAYVKYPSWYDIFLVYKVFAPNVLTWTFRLLLTTGGTRSTSLMGIGRQPIEGGSSSSRYTPQVPSTRKIVLSSPGSSQVSPLQQYKIE